MTMLKYPGDELIVVPVFSFTSNENSEETLIGTDGPVWCKGQLPTPLVILYHNLHGVSLEMLPRKRTER